MTGEEKLPIYLEIGAKKTFAGALEWPGWCRSGRDEGEAIEVLVAHGPRYAQVLEGTALGFQPPGDEHALVAVERLEGNATTDFGAPAIAPSGDDAPLDEVELARFELRPSHSTARATNPPDPCPTLPAPGRSLTLPGIAAAT